MRTSSYMLLQPVTHFSDGTVVATVLAFHHGEGEQRYPFGTLATRDRLVRRP